MTRPGPGPVVGSGAADDAVADPAADLVRAIVAGRRPGVRFQPIVALRRGEVVGYEGLSDFGGVDPASVFARARTMGVLARLEAATLKELLAHRRALPANTFLTVNVEPDSLTSPEVDAVLARAMPLAGVVIELTEHVDVWNDPALGARLQRLRAAGVLLAMDDAGSGYAGLQQILRLRPDVLKVDRELVAGVDRDESKRAMIEMLGTFGERIDAWLLCEGIERAGEARTLVQLGVPLAQGYWLSRPGPAFPGIDPVTAAELIAAAADAVAGDGLAPLVDVAPWTGADEPAAASLLDDVDLVVLLDANRRAVGVLDAAGAMTGTAAVPFRVNVATPPALLARRILTRPADERFTPVVVHDAAGRYLGVVRIERLLDALADGTGSGPR